MLHESTLWSSCLFLHWANVLTSMPAHWARRIMILHLRGAVHTLPNTNDLTLCQQTAKENTGLFICSWCVRSQAKYSLDVFFHTSFSSVFKFKSLTENDKCYTGSRKDAERVCCKVQVGDSVDTVDSVKFTTLPLEGSMQRFVGNCFIPYSYIMWL